MESTNATKVQRELIEDFLEKEEEQNIKELDLSESLISETKKIVELLTDNKYEYELLESYLKDLDDMLQNECNDLEKNVTSLINQKNNIADESKEVQKRIDRKSDNYLSKFESLKIKEEKKDLEITITEENYKEIANIIEKNFGKKNEIFAKLNLFYQQNGLLQSKVEKLKETKEELIKSYKNLLKENLNFKAKNETFEIKKILDFLEEISAEDKIKGGKQHKQKIKELETQYYSVVNEYNTLAEQILNIVRSLEGLNIDNPRLTKELEIINKELYPFEKRLNRSFTQMYENHDWDDIEVYQKLATENQRNNYKKIRKSGKNNKSTII